MPGNGAKGWLGDDRLGIDPATDVIWDGKRITVETEDARLRPLDADLQVPDTRIFRQHTGW